MKSGFKWATLRFLALLAMIATFLTLDAFATANVSLAWDPSVSPSIDGYRLYYGTTSRQYTNVVEVGATTAATISNLLASTTYFFAVTAYDIAGLESDFSTEVSYTVEAPVSRLNISIAPAGATLSGAGPAGYRYSVLTSSNLWNWTTLTNITMDATGAFTLQKFATPEGSARFYRLQQTSP